MLFLALALPVLGLGICAVLGISSEQLAGELSAEQQEALRPLLSALGPLLAALAGPLSQGAVLGVGGLLLVGALWPTRGPSAQAEPGADRAEEAEGDGLAPVAEASTLPKKERKRQLKRAQALVDESGAEAAGEFLLGCGLRDEAAELFGEHGLHQRLAEVRHDQNRFSEAAEWFEKAGSLEAAGATYAQVEQFEDAARVYLAAEKYSVAGEMLERAGKLREAGDAYAKIGFHRLAAQAYLGAGAELKAAESLRNAFTEEGGGGASLPENKRRELSGMGRKAGELFAKLERFEEAEQMFMRCGAIGLAAKVAFHTGEFDRAADLFVRVGRGDLAAKCYEELGDPQRAARAAGQFLRERGDEAQAAEQLEKAGEYEEAGDLFRQVECFDRAAECYWNGSDYSAAAEMFRVAELPARAAEAFAKAGDFQQAAGCYAEAGELRKQAQMLELAGDGFAAGQLFAAEGEPDEAIRLLQQVGSDSPRFAEACSILGRIFAEKGMQSLSVKKFEEAVGDGSLTRENVRAHYDLAGACETHDDFARAAEIYERILSFDYHYEDVAERLEHARQQAGAAIPAELRADGPPTPGAGGAASIQRYELMEEIGRGGMGVVYRARDSVLERDVAFKVLPEQLRESPSALKAFLREAKAAAQLNHPNIVTVYDAGESPHGFYLAMELVIGTTLKSIVKRRGPLPASGALFILRQMAEALHYAHTRKVVHRDIKTANTMWTNDKQVKIMDFGLARLMEGVRNATTSISGTPFYMSPEQTLGRAVDHRTDLYSLGVTLFELVTGELPFPRGNIPYHHVHTAPPDPREQNPELPEALGGLILRCLAKDPEERFQSALEIQAEIDRLVSS